jgi:hypothetical protein
VALTENTASSIVACWFTVAEMCLRHRCIATSGARTTELTALLLLCAFASAGMCLPSRCLARNYSGFQTSCHNIYPGLPAEDFRYLCLLSHSSSIYEKVLRWRKI